MTLRRGDTLIEFLAAFAVITSGLMAVMGLVYSNRTLAQSNADQVVATNLAREGVELVKQLRDSNWLAGSPFDGVASSPMRFKTITPVWDGVTAAPVFDDAANDFSSPDTNIVTLTGANAGLMTNSNAKYSITGTVTPYSRLLTLTAICDDGTGTFPVSNGITCSSGTKKGVRIQSEVRWTRDTIKRSVVMYDDLYDWR